MRLRTYLGAAVATIVPKSGRFRFKNERTFSYPIFYCVGEKVRKPGFGSVKYSKFIILNQGSATFFLFCGPYFFYSFLLGAPSKMYVIKNTILTYIIKTFYTYNKITTNCTKYDHCKCRRSETHNYYQVYLFRTLTSHICNYWNKLAP